MNFTLNLIYIFSHFNKYKKLKFSREYYQSVLTAETEGLKKCDLENDISDLERQIEETLKKLVACYSAFINMNLCTVL